MNDPKRLRDGEEATELRALLLAAGQDVLDHDATRRVRASLIATVPTAGIAGGGAAAGAIRGTAASKALMVALLAAAAGVGTYVHRSPAVSQSSPPAAAIASSSPALTTLTTLTTTTTSSATAPAPLPSVATPVIAPRPSVERAVVRTAAPSARAPSVPSPREGLLLLQARQALDHDPARALALIRQHEREFPNSQLAPERAKLATEAESRTTD